MVKGKGGRVKVGSEAEKETISKKAKGKKGIARQLNDDESHDEYGNDDFSSEIEL